MEQTDSLEKRRHIKEKYKKKKTKTFMNNKWKLKLPTQLLQKINYVKKISLQKKNRKIEKLVKTMKQKKKDRTRKLEG